MLIMIIMIAVDMMMWFSALGSFAHQRLFFSRGSEDHEWLVECVGASLMRKEKPKCGRAVML